MSDASEAEPLAPSAERAGSSGAAVSEVRKGDGDGKSGVDRLPDETR